MAITIDGKTYRNLPQQVAKNANDIEDILEGNLVADYLVSKGVPYITTAPTAANASGNLIVVVLGAEPADYFDGYLYLIAEE